MHRHGHGHISCELLMSIFERNVLERYVRALMHHLIGIIIGCILCLFLCFVCSLSLSLTFSIQRCNRISNYFIERSIESSVSSYWDCHVNYLYRHHINANTHTFNWGDRDREKEWASTVKCQQIMNWLHYPHSILSLEVSLKFNFQ